VTFTEILDQYQVPYLTEGHRHCRAGWVQIDCPFCGRNSDKYHMGYKLDGGYLSCWKCRGHSLYSTLMEITGEDASQISKLLKGIERETFEPKAREKKGELVLPKPLEALTKAHLTYLEDRGFEGVQLSELIRLWKVQACGPFTRVKTPEGKKINLAWRLFIPFINGGEIVSWTTRTISEKVSLRYISAPPDCEAISHKDILYGQDYCSHAACAVEGPIDVWRGGPGFVATAGTQYTRAQVNALSRYAIRGVCFDNEPEAQRSARMLCDELSAFPGKTLLFQIDSKDLGEASAKEIRSIRRALRI
jgi:hypothetical protein